jgi:hypothetical protein
MGYVYAWDELMILNIAALSATSLTCGAGFWEVNRESDFGMWKEGNFEGGDMCCEEQSLRLGVRKRG